MAKAVLTDAQWRLMEPHCLGKPPDHAITNFRA